MFQGADLLVGYLVVLQNVAQASGLGRILLYDVRSENCKRRSDLGTSGDYRSGLVKAVSRELASYSLDVMGAQEIHWDHGGTDQTLQQSPDIMLVSSSPRMYILPRVDK